MIQPLSVFFCITLIDLPGFGKSHDITGLNYELNTVVQQVLEVAPQQAIWLGWSMGGLIAAQVAIQAPEKIIKLITVASAPKFIKTNDWPGTSLANLSQFAAALQSNYIETLTHFLRLQFYGTNVNTNKIQKLVTELLQVKSPASQILEDSLQLLKTTDSRADLIKIQCPTLMMFGKWDAMIPVAVIEKIKLLQPAINHYIFTQASHTPFLSHEAEFIKVVNSFCYDKS